jgi:class 3 adenylate cyclase
MRPPEFRLRLAAILAAYSRLMSVDARETIEALETARRTFQTISIANDGRVVDTAGDSVLAIFKTAAGATSAALAIQHELETHADAMAEDRRLRFRLGLHLGDVMQKADGSVYGDGVNVAARLQSAALAGGIVVSESIRLAVRGKVATCTRPLTCSRRGFTSCATSRSSTRRPARSSKRSTEAWAARLRQTSCRPRRAPFPGSGLDVHFPCTYTVHVHPPFSGVPYGVGC